MIKFIPYVVITAFAGLALSAAAQDAEQVPNKKLEQRGERIEGPVSAIAPAALLIASFDRNFDYTISAPEIEAGLTQTFTSADKDKSGHLTMMELQNWRRAALGDVDAQPVFLAFDKDFDQRISKAEFDKVLRRTIERADKDENGEIMFSDLIRVFEMPRRPVIDEDIEDLQRRLDRSRRQDGQLPRY